MMFSALVEPTDWTLQISADRQEQIWQQSRTFTTAWGRWNAYLNQLCLETCLTWLKAEYLPTARAGMAPALWEMITGSIVTVGKMRIALIPTETIDRSELAVPQEWVDIPSWAADYYLGVQIDLDCRFSIGEATSATQCQRQGYANSTSPPTIALYGFTTHQQLKTQATYDAQERTYCLDVDDLIPDLNALWLAYPHYTTSQTRAPSGFFGDSLPSSTGDATKDNERGTPALDPAQVDRLITRLGNRDLIMPSLEVPFQTWAALLEHPQWQQRLCQQRQTGNSTPAFTQLNLWLVGQIDWVWQSLEACVSISADRVLLPQQIAIAVRSTASNNTLEISPGGVYQAQVFNLGGGQIALLVGISPISDTESRISLQVHPAGGEAYLPGETQLRLLTPDGSEIGKVSATVTETIQLQFCVSAGEQFEIEIACGGQILTERFEA